MSNEQRYMDVAHDLNLIAIGQSAGVVYWKPAGMVLYEKLKSFIKEQHQKNHYLEVKSPSIVSPQLFEQSGHNEKYKENMFFLNSNKEEQGYALRPMSCPNHILIYQSEGRSYKQLPLPLFEFGEVFRNEPSGSLQLLFRQRQFCQDDAHVFVNQDNLISSIVKYLQMSQEVYQKLGFQHIEYAISLRPEQRFGSDEIWDNAENSLRQACQMQNISFQELPGEGAFYGPKIELKVRDKLNRAWQLGTLQLDYVLPQRFNMEFVNEEGKKEIPIILHHAVLGSLERMIGILLESFGKELPAWLHPHPAIIIPISEKSHDYAEQLSKHLNIPCDKNNEPLGKKLEYWRNKGVPDIYVVGEKEAQLFENSSEYHAVLNQGKIRKSVKI